MGLINLATGSMPAPSPTLKSPPVLALSPAAKEFRKRRVVRISGSRYRNFQACKKQWALDEFLYLPNRSRENKSYVLQSGDAMHSGWQMYLRTKSLDMALATLAVCWPHDHPFAKKNRPFWRAQDALIEACNHPYSQYALVQVERGGELIPAIELAVELVVELEFMEIHYTGYIDAVVVDPNSGLPMVLDLKSTVYPLDTWRLKYTYDTQVPAYTIIVSAIAHSGLLGKNARGCYLGTYMSGSGEAWTYALDVECGKKEALYFIHDLQLFAAQVATFQNADRFPRSPEHCQQYGSPCRHLGRLCQLETLTELQNEVDGLRFLEDGPQTEFTPDFTIRYTPELLE